jgi:hypothetical protein
MSYDQGNAAAMPAAETIADDKLTGAVAIAEFIGEKPRRTFHLLSSGLLPAGKLGGERIASRRVLRARYAALTGASL